MIRHMVWIRRLVRVRGSLLHVCLCHCSCIANPETVIRVLLVLRILMCLPPYDTGLNSGHKVCFRQESPPDAENWVRSLTANHHIPYCPAVKIPFLRPTYMYVLQGKKRGWDITATKCTKLTPPFPPSTMGCCTHTSLQYSNKNKQDV